MVANGNQDLVFLSSSKCTCKRQKVNILRISIIYRVDVAILPTCSNPPGRPCLCCWYGNSSKSMACRGQCPSHLEDQASLPCRGQALLVPARLGPPGAPSLRTHGHRLQARGAFSVPPASLPTGRTGSIAAGQFFLPPISNA